MTDQGERSPSTDSAASIVGRTAAIDAAFADFPELNDDDFPSAVEKHRVETPVEDAPPAVASTEKPEENSIDASQRPVEGQPVSPTSQDPLEAPKHWPEDRRKTFQSLPDDAKRVILERNKEANVAVTRAQQEAAQYRRTHESLTSVFTDDHKREMQAAGFDEVTTVKHLLGLYDSFNKDPLSVFANIAQRDPVGFLKAAAERLGVKADALLGQQPPQGQPGQPAMPPQEDEWQDPALISLEQRLSGKLSELEQWKAAQERERQEQQRSEQVRFNQWFTEQCNSFENAIDDEGHPKYPHLQAVFDDVIRLVQSDPAANALLRSNPHAALEKAYSQALYLNPEIRQQIIDEEFAKRLQASESAKSVQKAQAAATRKGSPGANGQAQPKARMSREEAINKAFQDVLGQ